jgi:hypothetical protein
MAMIAVPRVIRAIVNTRVVLRPCRSAYAPRTNAPIGLTTKGIANVAKVVRSEANWFEAGKKSLAMDTAKKPNATKSNHSNALAIEVETITFRRSAWTTARGLGEEDT